MIDEEAIENLPYGSEIVSSQDALPVDAMNEATFKVLYANTARSIWRYLHRAVNNVALADDLLQDTFFRFLRTPLPEMTLEQQRSYLFKIATRLIQDHWRHSKRERFWFSSDSSDSSMQTTASHDPTPSQLQRREMAQHFLGLTPQERSLLWLAYVEGSEHGEIAKTLGLKQKSVRVLLFRARRKLASLIRESQKTRGGL
jgi:RNA polymerase sigma-70 factor (ECF subfamily)